MSVPPTGTVTFLFTDIEGSTKMWERDATTMQAALARHDEILQSMIEDHLGYVFKTVGDAFCAAFPTAPDALEAALEGFLEIPSRTGVIDSLGDVGAVAGARGEHLRAARLWGAADALREVAEYTLSVSEAGMYKPYMSAARSELGETAFRAVWEEGRAMTEEQAIALALENEENDANFEETEPV